ncbi:MAG: hypothetical protein BGO01_03875 [Armatimonadetes bacterium 55-13]|nr:nuclear transport factor 2 family protein [Armatimonadota bacterium]OJU63289.1 MAG: hypothetical protein BGO01_03875 [Armatimonadetes bacterium 55-13]
MSNRANELVELVLQGQILEAFETYYHDDVVMQENGSAPTVGKDANRTREEQFVGFVKELHQNQATKVIVDGEHSAIHWELEFTGADDKRYRYNQIAVQKWSDGKVVHEQFFYNPGEGQVA